MTGLSLHIKNGILLFAGLTGRAELAPDEVLLSIILLAVGILLCFVGFRFYRVCFTAAVYLATVVLWCVLLKGRMDWGDLVTGFSVTGCVLGFLAFRWTTLGAVLLPVIYAGAGAYVLLPSFWVTIAVCAVTLFLAYGLPVLCLRVSTAAFGAALILEAVTLLWLPDVPWFAVIPLCALGFGTQTLFSVKYKSNVEVYRGWAKKAAWHLRNEKRRGAEKNAV